MSQLLARAFATQHDLVPQGIGALPEPGCEAPPNQFGGVRTLQRALQILIVSDCLFSSFKLDHFACSSRAVLRRPLPRGLVLILTGEASTAIIISLGEGAPTSGISTALTTSAALPNASIWIAFMAALSTDIDISLPMW